MSETRETVAAVLAGALRTRGIESAFGLQGGHIQPLIDELARVGVDFIDVRDERAAVHMAQARAELTGAPAVALVTSGPGVTNTITAAANAHVSRIPVIILAGGPPRPQHGRGALQELPHVELLRPVTRHAACVSIPERAVAMFDEAAARARASSDGPGPVYLEYPADVLRASGGSARIAAQGPPPEVAVGTRPEPARVEAAAHLLAKARRPVILGGRGLRPAAAALRSFLDDAGCLYLETQESRGVVSDDHPASVFALRGEAMREADLIVTLNRKLDYQLAYGSPAVFRDAAFLRISDTMAELIDNRRGEAEIQGDVGEVLTALQAALPANVRSARDTQWLRGAREKHEQRLEKARTRMRRAADSADGRMHPFRLLTAVQDAVGSKAVAVADGGDILSFARVALRTERYLDSGALGCLGVGVPYGIAAALTVESMPVAVVCGDGALGFNIAEIETAVRRNAPAVFIVANNAAWNIERHDQMANYDGRVVGTELTDADYAAVARGFGMRARRIETPEALDEAMTWAFANPPALLDVLVTRDAVSPDGASGLASVPDLQALKVWDDLEVQWRESQENPEGDS